MLQSLSVCVSVRRWVTSAVCAAGVKGVQGWPTGTSWVSSLLSMSWPPGRDSSTAGWAASGSSSSHHYVAEVRGSLLSHLILFIVHITTINKVCVCLCTLLHRECVSITGRAVHSPLLFSLWEFFPFERSDWATLRVTYLLPAWRTGSWCHFPTTADAHQALSGHL